MSKSRWSRLRTSLSGRRSTGRRPLAHRNLAFESLETRQLLSVTALTDFSVSTNTGEKPQSKVWEYNDQWYSVMADNGGTWVWKLNGSEWQHELRLSQNSSANADVKAVGDMAHILLYDGPQSQLATIQYDTGAGGYDIWSLRPSLVNVALSSGVETATLDMDSTGRLWIASDVKTTVEVRYADFSSQYTNWSGPITVASGINSDDISVITAMPGNQIGVMWSNQSADRFGFRVHVDGAEATSWSANEIPASQSALNKGGGMADDHLNLAVASNGTVYAAVKTSYDSSGFPAIALLVRRPSGVWDNLYQVDTKGTRPIVILNEAAGKLIVAYTSANKGGTIYYKESSMNQISFGDRQTLISGSNNNVTSIKGNFTDDVVVMASSSGKVRSALFRFDGPVVNLPPVVSAGADRTIQVGTTLTLNGTVTDDGLLNLTPTSLWTKVSGPGTVTFGDDLATDTTVTFSQAGTYVLQLAANDGELSAADTVTIIVESAPEPASNQAPIVDAGPDQTITLPALANLSGSVSDSDGPLATPLVNWSVVSGPGSVTFGDASSVNTTANFSVAGTYVLRLTASDGLLAALDDVSVTVSSNTDPVSISFQDGLFPTISYQGTRDTKLASKSSNSNYGTAATIDLDGSPDVSDLLYWDISAIPAGSVIESVTIQLNVTNTSSQAYNLYAMQQAWDELSATWNQASNGNPWAAAGAQGTADHDSTAVGTFNASSTGLHQIVLNAGGTAAVQAWIDDPSTNRGLIIQDYGNSNGIDFSASETSAAAQRPKLVVTYRPADGGAAGDPPPTNQAPTVNAGSDQTIQLPGVATLNGTVTDDGLPSSPGTVTRTWTRISGPGTVTFGDASSANTTASFSAAGTYVLRLSANDGSLAAFDEVTVTVLSAAPLNQAPVVHAGSDQTIQLPNTAALNGTVTDDGLLNLTLTLLWTKVSGPGSVTFGNASSDSTTANFSVAGIYVLRLTANDGQLLSLSDVTITVQTEPT